jgi:hypothetical protein
MIFSQFLLAIGNLRNLTTADDQKISDMKFNSVFNKKMSIPKKCINKVYVKLIYALIGIKIILYFC